MTAPTSRPLLLTWSGTEVRGRLEGPVGVGDGPTIYATLRDAFASNDALVLRRDTKITLAGALSDEFEGDWPFDETGVRLDPVTWAGAWWDSAFGEGDWYVDVDDSSVFVMIRGLEFAAPKVAVKDRGIVLEIDAGGTSMSTGDIGLTLSVDEWGGVWVDYWGAQEFFLGIVSIDDPVGAIESTLDLAYGEVAEIRSEILDDAEFDAAVARLRRASWVEITEDTILEPPGSAST